MYMFGLKFLFVNVELQRLPKAHTSNPETFTGFIFYVSALISENIKHDDVYARQIKYVSYGLG